MDIKKNPLSYGIREEVRPLVFGSLEGGLIDRREREVDGPERQDVRCCPGPCAARGERSYGRTGGNAIGEHGEIHIESFIIHEARPGGIEFDDRQVRIAKRPHIDEIAAGNERDAHLVKSPGGLDGKDQRKYHDNRVR